MTRQQKRFEALEGDTPALITDLLGEKCLLSYLVQTIHPTSKCAVSPVAGLSLQEEAGLLSAAITGEDMAYEETRNGIWSLTFCDVLLAHLDERTHKLEAASP